MLGTTTTSQQKLPATSSVAGWHGIDSLLTEELLGYKPHRPVVSTACFGRIFLEGTPALFRPSHEITKDGVAVVPPLLDALAHRGQELRVGNFGCGGATDVPLLQELLQSHVGSDVPVRVENFDLSDTVVNAVKSGTHLHFRSYTKDDFPREWPKDDLLVPATETAISQYFSPAEISDRSSRIHPDQTYFPYVMRPEAVAKLNIEQGDIRAISRPDEHYAVVICLNVALYLTGEGQWLGFHEAKRVLMPGGWFISDGAMFQKQGQDLVLRSGYEDRTGGGSKFEPGLYPTFLEGGSHRPFSTRRFTGDANNGFSRWYPSETFIGRNEKPVPSSDDF